MAAEHKPGSSVCRLKMIDEKGMAQSKACDSPKWCDGGIRTDCRGEGDDDTPPPPCCWPMGGGVCSGLFSQTGPRANFRGTKFRETADWGPMNPLVYFASRTGARSSQTGGGAGWRHWGGGVGS